MKRIFISLALILPLGLFSLESMAQGVYIYKDGKRQVFTSNEVDSLVFYQKQNKTNPTIQKVTFEMPSNLIGKSKADIISAEKARGFTVNEKSSSILELKKTINGIDYAWTYNFDTKDNYKYAKCNIQQNKLDEFKAFLRASGYELRTKASLNAEVTVYLNKDAKKVIYINKEADKYEFFFGEWDESLHSWMRISNLRDDNTNILAPYYGHYATVELMKLYEKRMNHKLVSNPELEAKGIYTYETNDQTWLKVKYWFDVKTKNKLEEASIFVDKDGIPTPDNVTTYLKKYNYRYTGMTDNDGYTVYYNDAEKSVCYVLMVEKKGENGESKGKFEPQMHFTYSDLTGKVPPEKVDFPMPIIDFGKMTMDEAVKKYRSLPYYKAEQKADGGIYIMTTSKDFPAILLLEDNGKYLAAINITYDALTCRSPYITDMLTNQGYVYNPKVSAMPTFINKDKDIMVQFYLTDVYNLGYFSISFQPNEFK